MEGNFTSIQPNMGSSITYVCCTPIHLNMMLKSLLAFGWHPDNLWFKVKGIWEKISLGAKEGKR
jgi:hypothetical protein